MKKVKSTFLPTGYFYGLEGAISVLTREVVRRNQLVTGDFGSLIYVAGPSGRGKSFISEVLAISLETTLSLATGVDREVILINADTFSYEQDGKWLTNAEELQKAYEERIAGGTMNDGPIVVFEGTSDNFYDCVRTLAEVIDFNHSSGDGETLLAGIIVEPSVWVSATINRLKLADSVTSKFPVSWIKHWEKMATMGYSKAVEYLREETVHHSKLIQEKIGMNYICVRNDGIGTVDAGWHSFEDATDHLRLTKKS